MASKRRNMFHKNKKQETTEIGTCNLPPFCDWGSRGWGSEDLDHKKLKEKIKYLRMPSNRSSCSSCSSEGSTRILIQPRSNAKMSWIICTLGLILLVILITFATL
ncbi:hypothetical protein AAG570_001629 [Ranatra chinensis]|uniref:Uncharacterized protein n=1 Tax=Ranatra chinensis TaxID=642074 RepID=A0ABD0YB12_9HEMI